MAAPDHDYLTTREVAALLRIKERKVYDLASSGRLPCSRAMGKLLFPRRAVQAWIAGAGVTPAGAAPAPGPRPNVLLGSHDPLLDWALRESRAPLASLLDGSLDGLERFAAGEGVAAGLHVRGAQDWNVEAVQARFDMAPVVLLEWAWRERGLIVHAEVPDTPHTLGALRGRRVVPRQPEAGSQQLFEQLLAEAGIDADAVEFTAPARSESDLAAAVLEGKAEAGFGLRAMAHRHRLGFVPLIRERFDLLVDRRSWFEPPLQALDRFCRSPTFRAMAAELSGYDVSGYGTVRFNAGA